MRRYWCMAVVLLAAAAGPRLYAAGEIDDAVARMTAGVMDPGNKARKILEAVQSLDIKPDLAAGLLERALDLAGQGLAEPTTLQTALDVLGELDKRAPAKAAQWSAKRLDLCRRAFQAAPDKNKLPAATKAMDVLGALGDQAAEKAQWAAANDAYGEALKVANIVGSRRMLFEAKLRLATGMADAERKVAALKAKLAEAPDDPGNLTKVLEALVVDKDDPQAAAKLVTAQTDEPWRTCLPLAAKNPQDLPAAACMDVYKWYRQALAPKAGELAKEHMLRRARTFLQAAADRGELKDLEAMEAKTQLGALDMELRQYDPVAGMVARQGFVDLARLVDLETDATPEGWLLSKGVLISSTKPGGVLAFPVDATGDYRLTVAFAKTQSSGDIHFSFPVGGRYVGLNIHEVTTRGPRGSVGIGPRTTMTMRLEDLEGPPAPSATNPMNPEYASHPWAAYTLEVAVKTVGDSVEIATTLNGGKWAWWKGSTKGLLGPPAASGRAFTAQFSEPGLAISAAKLRPSSGEVTLAGGKPGDEPRTPPLSGRPVRRPAHPVGVGVKPVPPPTE